MATRACLICREEFTVTSGRVKFCGRPCYVQYRKGLLLSPRVEKSCAQCKAMFLVTPSKVGQKFCSQWCSREYEQEQWAAYWKSEDGRGTKATQRRVKRLRSVNSKFLWEYLLKHPCVDCGEPDPVVLQFDHVRGKKKFGVSTMTKRRTISLICEEIKKCDVRCANCHQRRHAQARGTYRAIRNKEIGIQAILPRRGDIHAEGDIDDTGGLGRPDPMAGPSETGTGEHLAVDAARAQ